MRKDKKIQIRTNEDDKERVEKVVKKKGFETISAFFWFAVSYFEGKKK